MKKFIVHYVKELGGESFEYLEGASLKELGEKMEYEGLESRKTDNKYKEIYIYEVGEHIKLSFETKNANIVELLQSKDESKK